MKRLLIIHIIFLLLLTSCTGVAGPLGYTGMTPEQIAATAKIKDVGLFCAHGVYGGATVNILSINADKGVPSSVTVDIDCKATFGTVLPSPSK